MFYSPLVVVFTYTLFLQDGDRFLESANALKYWPTGRGIYLNADETFLIWVGEEDHLRIISMQKGGNLFEVVERLRSGLEILEKSFEWSHSEKYGYMTSCPTNIGTTIRSSVLIKLPKLSRNLIKFQQIVKDHKLQVGLRSLFFLFFVL